MTALSSAPRSLPWFVQVVIIALASVLITLIADRLQFRTPWNYIWIFVAPAMIGATLNTGAVRRVAMALLLPAVSMISLMTTGQLFGSMS